MEERNLREDLRRSHFRSLGSEEETTYQVRYIVAGVRECFPFLTPAIVIVGLSFLSLMFFKEMQNR